MNYRTAYLPVSHMSPVHPAIQVHEYDPSVFTHVAPFVQESDPDVHSSISENNINNLLMCFIF